MAISVIFSFKLYEAEQNAKDRYLSIVVAVDFTRDRVKKTNEKIDRLLERQRYDHETDLAYQTELAKTMTKNDEYFDGLLGNIETDIWLLRQSEHYSNEEILKRIGIVIELSLIHI